MGKAKNYSNSKETDDCQGLREEKNELTELVGFLGQWNYSLWYYSGKYVALHICPNSQNVHQEGGNYVNSELWWQQRWVSEGS